MNLIYINSGVGSVFQAQVIKLLDYYANINAFRRIILLCGYKNKAEFQSATSILKEKPFEVWFFKQYPNYSFYNLLIKRSIYKTLKKCKISDTNNTIFHIRGELAAYFSYDAIKRCGYSSDNILVDVRGVSRDEYFEFQRKTPLLSRLKLYNINNALANLHKPGVISAVSESLANYLLQLPVRKHLYLETVHSFASKSFTYDDKLRNQIREQLGIGNNTKLFVFSTAGVAGWQNNQVIGQLATRGFYVLNLSPLVIDHPIIINRYLPYEQVPAYLCAADIAIIIREHSIVNKVASPVKFSEYVCCGLPVISNKSVDLISEYAYTSNHVALIDNISDINDALIEELCGLSRNAISEKAQNIFGIETIAGKYIKLYTKMNNT